MATGNGQSLVEQGLLEPEQFAWVRQQMDSTRSSLVDVILSARLVPEPTLLRALAEEADMDFVSLRDISVADDVIALIPSKLVSHYGIFPVARDARRLTIAVADPQAREAVEDLQVTVGLRVERVLACRQEIADAIQQHYGVGAATIERLLTELPAEELSDPDGMVADSLDSEDDEASVVQLVNQFLLQAIKDRTTDVHFEVYRGQVTARRRIDGVLFDTQVPREIDRLYPAIVSRIKLMAGLNIVEKRLPQDGRARVTMGGEDFDLRISVVPSLHGENIVIRILPTSMLFSLEGLGMTDENLAMMEACVERPHGIVFVTGPTGSGKSTTLYACLSRLNTRERKIITIEDPVEYELPGAMQTQVNTRIDLNFSTALRSMLRHDPDVMMVGEVRDQETAEVTIQTALTGHFVLSTLHTNDAASGAVRLIDMGIDPYLITSSVLCFVAQRLVRRNCTECSEEVTENGLTFKRGAGCHECNHSGFHDRLAIYEFLPLGPEINELILRRAPAGEIRAMADTLGYSTLADDGNRKVADGLTTPEEVLRVTQVL